MIPELLYEIYKYIAPEQYLKLNALTILKHLVDTFKDPLEAKYIYFNGEPIEGLNHGLKYIALTNPNYRWVSRYNTHWHLIEYASGNGHLEVVKLLLEDERVDPSVSNNYTIKQASYKGHLEIVKLLLEDERVDPSASNNRAIGRASASGHLEVVKLLLGDERVDPSANDNWAIRWASRNGYREIVRLLLEDKRVDPSDDNNCAIRWASGSGHLEIVKLLLEGERVRQSLTDTQIEKYLKQINYKNELNYHLMTISIQ